MSITLAQLKSINGEAYGLFGYPLSHSMSEELHSLLNSEVPYFLVEIKPDEIYEALNVAKEKLLGFNITIPYKNLIAKELKQDFAVNTVKVLNNEFFTENTDVLALKFLFSEIVKKGDSVAVLGGGGAAAACIRVLQGLGANITVAVRNVEKVNFGVKVVDIKDLAGNYNLLVNCTPVGMYKNEGVSPVDLDKVKPSYVFDVIYNPLETKLLADAKIRGIPCQNGLMMLILQGAFAQTFWNGKETSEEEIEEIYEKLSANLLKKRLKEVYDKENILLFGFMGCGKTTIGKALAGKLGFSFIDSDSIIETDNNMSIADIFKLHGEGKFRELEQKAIKKALLDKNAVISVGGGAPFYKNNTEILKENAVCVFLDAPFDVMFDRINNDKSRPNAKDYESTKVLFEKRYEGYKKLADKIIPADIAENEVIKTIIEKI